MDSQGVARGQVVPEETTQVTEVSQPREAERF